MPVDEVKDALDSLIAPVAEKHRDADAAKVDQLEGAVATVKMVLDQLQERADTRAEEQGAQ